LDRWRTNIIRVARHSWRSASRDVCYQRQRSRCPVLFALVRCLLERDLQCFSTCPTCAQVLIYSTLLRWVIWGFRARTYGFGVPSFPSLNLTGPTALPQPQLVVLTCCLSFFFLCIVLYYTQPCRAMDNLQHFLRLDEVPDRRDLVQPGAPPLPPTRVGPLFCLTRHTLPHRRAFPSPHERHRSLDDLCRILEYTQIPHLVSVFSFSLFLFLFLFSSFSFSFLFSLPFRYHLPFLLSFLAVFLLVFPVRMLDLTIPLSRHWLFYMTMPIILGTLNEVFKISFSPFYFSTFQIQSLTGLFPFTSSFSSSLSFWRDRVCFRCWD